MLISKIILSRFFAIVDNQTSFTFCQGVGKFGMLRVGHFTSDSTTLPRGVWLCVCNIGCYSFGQLVFSLV